LLTQWRKSMPMMPQQDAQIKAALGLARWQLVALVVTGATTSFSFISMNASYLVESLGWDRSCWKETFATLAYAADLLANTASLLVISGILDDGMLHKDWRQCKAAMARQCSGVLTPRDIRQHEHEESAWTSALWEAGASCFWHPSRSHDCNEQERAWNAKVVDLAHRGISLEALLKFYSELGVGIMRHFNPAKHSTADVVRQAIIPESGVRGSRLPCALATIMMRGERCRPQKMVTHNWGNLFVHLVAAIVADALDQPYYNDGGGRSLVAELSDPSRVWSLRDELHAKGKLQTTYWVCAFAVDQHKTICGANPRGDVDPVLHKAHPVCRGDTEKFRHGPDCEVNKFDDMMMYLASKVPNFTQVITVDRDFDLFTRAWCIAEINLAHLVNLRQVIKVESGENLSEHREDLRGLRVQDMKASVESDKQFILGKIPDKALFNRALQDLIFNPHSGLMRASRDGASQASMLGKVARWALSEAQMRRQDAADAAAEDFFSI